VEIRWLDSAVADLEAIQDYLLERNPAAAQRLVAVLREATSGLAAMPHRGRPGRWPGTRELVIPGTPYLIPYRVRGEVIEILRVFHGARRWPPAFEG
jgi:toxin ParE1/3/4